MLMSSLRIYVRQLVDDNNNSEDGRWTDSMIDAAILRAADNTAQILAQTGRVDLLSHEAVAIVNGEIDLALLPHPIMTVQALSVTSGAQIVPIRRGGMADEGNIVQINASASISYFGKTRLYTESGSPRIALCGIEGYTDITIEQVIALTAAIDLQSTEGETVKALAESLMSVRNIMMGSATPMAHSRTISRRISNNIPIWQHTRWRYQGRNKVIFYV
jgi:hypothetical protein